jgi:hypothetical protein
MIDVRADYDTSADFARLRTYTWLQKPSDAPRDPRTNNDLLDSRVHAAVNEELHAKGYTESTERPDFRVTYHVILKEKLEPTTYGYGLGSSAVAANVRAATYEEGMLLVDLVDGTTNELVWRGSAQARVDPTLSPLERTKLIRTAVHGILEKFPPKR